MSGVFLSTRSNNWADADADAGAADDDGDNERGPFTRLLARRDDPACADWARSADVLQRAHQQPPPYATTGATGAEGAANNPMMESSIQEREDGRLRGKK